MTTSPPDASKKITAGVCAILLGTFGVHKFILGYTTEGLIMLLGSLVGGVITCGLATGVMSIIALVEGIIYLTMSDEQFINTYILNKKGWL
ncbi:MAG: TM2 domain-containing protein [Gloeomargarita sp. HHBFW_bins_162]